MLKVNNRSLSLNNSRSRFFKNGSSKSDNPGLNVSKIQVEDPIFKDIDVNLNEIELDLPLNTQASHYSDNDLLGSPKADELQRNFGVQGFGVTIKKKISSDSLDTVKLDTNRRQSSKAIQPSQLKSLSEDGTKVMVETPIGPSDKSIKDIFVDSSLERMEEKQAKNMPKKLEVPEEVTEDPNDYSKQYGNSNDREKLELDQHHEELEKMGESLFITDLFVNRPWCVILTGLAIFAFFTFLMV